MTTKLMIFLSLAITTTVLASDLSKGPEHNCVDTSTLPTSKPEILAGEIVYFNYVHTRSVGRVLSIPDKDTLTIDDLAYPYPRSVSNSDGIFNVAAIKAWPAVDCIRRHGQEFYPRQTVKFTRRIRKTYVGKILMLFSDGTAWIQAKDTDFKPHEWRNFFMSVAQLKTP
jgi:hypothetical protein